MFVCADSGSLANREGSSRSRILAGACAAGVLLLGSAWLLSYPGGLPGELAPFATWPLLHLAWAGTAVWWLVSLGRFAWRLVKGKPTKDRATALVAGSLVLLLGVALFSGWALRLRFELSETAFEELARTRLDTPRTVSPGRTGLYDVQAIRSGSGGSTVLVTNTCGPASECGFAYSPAGAPPDVCKTRTTRCTRT